MTGITSTDDELLGKWRADLNRVYPDVVDVLEQRAFYRELRSILEAGRERFAHMDGMIFRLIDKWYAHAAAFAVRKQVDGSSLSVCLRQLLEAIAPSAHVITREGYQARVGAEPDAADERARWEFEERRDWADRRFDDLAGADAEQLTEQIVRSDLDRLAGASAQIRRLVNKTLAHRDRAALQRREEIGIDVTATWDDLNGAIDLVSELLDKYNDLLGAGLAPGVPTYQWDWKEPLRVPWLLDGYARKLAREMVEGSAESDVARAYADDEDEHVG